MGGSRHIILFPQFLGGKGGSRAPVLLLHCCGSIPSRRTSRLGPALPAWHRPPGAAPHAWGQHRQPGAAPPAWDSTAALACVVMERTCDPPHSVVSACIGCCLMLPEVLLRATSHLLTAWHHGTLFSLKVEGDEQYRITQVNLRTWYCGKQPVPWEVNVVFMSCQRELLGAGSEPADGKYLSLFCYAF